MKSSRKPAPRHVGKRSLSEIFNTFAKEAGERFPEMKGHLLLLEMNEYKGYGCEDIDTKKTGLTPKTALTYMKRHSITREMRKDENFPSHAVRSEKKKLHMILFNERVAKEELQALSPKTEKEILFVLDHELAHFALPNAYYTGSDEYIERIVIAETVADAYAMLRYYQRYGTDDNFEHSIVGAWPRARDLIFNEDVDHFSTFMLEELEKRKNDIDFDTLTPAQTADLAWRFAMAFTPPGPVIEKICASMKTVQQLYNESPERSDWVKLLSRITLDKQNDYYTFRYCARLLNGYLDGQAGPFGKPMELNGKYWDNVRTRLKKREEELAKRNVLFNIPPSAKDPGRGGMSLNFFKP